MATGITGVGDNTATGVWRSTCHLLAVSCCVLSDKNVASWQLIAKICVETKKAEIIECVNDVKGDIRVQEVTCNHLKSRYADLYSSVYVWIQVDACDFPKAIDLFMSAQSWPAGVFVRRHFKRKDGSQQRDMRCNDLYL